MNTDQSAQTDTKGGDGSNSEQRVVRPSIIVEADRKETGPRFMELPERWMDNPHWRCENGHISTCYIKSEAKGRSACPACGGHIWLTFPEDRESRIVIVANHETICETRSI